MHWRGGGGRPSAARHRQTQSGSCPVSCPCSVYHAIRHQAKGWSQPASGKSSRTAQLHARTAAQAAQTSLLWPGRGQWCGAARCCHRQPAALCPFPASAQRRRPGLPGSHCFAVQRATKPAGWLTCLHWHWTRSLISWPPERGEGWGMKSTYDSSPPALILLC